MPRSTPALELGLGAESRTGVWLMERGAGSRICHRRCNTGQATWAATAQREKVAPRGSRQPKKSCPGTSETLIFLWVSVRTPGRPTLLENVRALQTQHLRF